MATLGGSEFPYVADRPVGSLVKARPARRAFTFSAHLLGGSSPLFNQLQQRLAAVAQPSAFLELVEQHHDFARQLEQHFLAPCGPKARAVGSIAFG